MGAYAHAQNVLTDDADHSALLSNDQSDNDVISSFAYMVNTPATGRRRGPGRGKVECPLSFFLLSWFMLWWWSGCTRVFLPSAEDIRQFAPEFYTEGAEITPWFYNQDTDALAWRVDLSGEPRDDVLQSLLKVCASAGWEVAEKDGVGPVLVKNRRGDWAEYRVRLVIVDQGTYCVLWVQSDSREEYNTHLKLSEDGFLRRVGEIRAR